MVVLNVNTTDSLVNGSLGVIEDIITDSNGNVTCVIIRFDTEKAGEEQRRQYPHIAVKYQDENGTPLFKEKIKYHLGASGGKVHAAAATVLQFPIKLAFAITGHKIQVNIKIIL